ncbi:MAG: hypothetical protein M0R06_22160 [Sphaerochaeta sp.]|jgi:hypothetical protein|nr:hypothetical protein [Sphaerochaeta sp.]
MAKQVLRMNDPRVTRIIAEGEQRRKDYRRGKDYRSVAKGKVSFSDRFPDGAWRGKRCFIVGGGPSLKGFDFERLRGERVIAINKAFYDVPFADIVFGMDRPLLDDLMSGKIDADYRAKNPDGPERNYQAAFAEFAGVKVWLDLSNYSYPEDVCSIPSAGEIGWTKSCKEGLYHGQNSGYGALNLAMVLGADPIYLLGYDCAKGPAGEKNYHGGYPSAGNPSALETFKEAFKAGAKMLMAGRHHIYNLNPDSALRCFPFMDISAVCGIGKGRAVNPEFMIVSYYTKGTGYEQEVKQLEASLKVHRLPYKIFEYEPAGTWRANLNFKSECILRAMDMFPGKDIVFLDSDAVVKQYPVLFDELSRTHDYDLSAHFFKYQPESGDADELLSGTLWIQNGEMGRRLIEKWHEIGLARTADTRHQLCLKIAIAELGKAGEKVRVNRHPFAYTCVFDYQQAYKTEPVIEHFQASRRLRKEVGYGVNLIHSRVAGKK